MGRWVRFKLPSPEDPGQIQSAIDIGTAWSLQGLWAAPWLAHVEGLSRAGVVRTLLVMGLALSGGALALGWLTDRAKTIGVSSEALLGCVASLFIAAQVAVILRLPVPGVLLRGIIATVGAATVTPVSPMIRLAAGYRTFRSPLQTLRDLFTTETTEIPPLPINCFTVTPVGRTPALAPAPGVSRIPVNVWPQ